MPQTLETLEEYALKFYPKKKAVVPPQTPPPEVPSIVPPTPDVSALEAYAQKYHPKEEEKKYSVGRAAVKDIGNIVKGLVGAGKLAWGVMSGQPEMRVDPRTKEAKIIPPWEKMLEAGQAAGKMPGAMIKRYGEIIKDPIGTLKEAPVSWLLDVAPVGWAGLKAAGAAVKTTRFVKAANAARAVDELSDWNRVFKHGWGLVEDAADVSPAKILAESALTPDNTTLGALAKTAVDPKDFIGAAHDSLSKTRPGIFRLFREYYGSPYEVFRADKTGYKVWNFSDRQDLAKASWMTWIYDKAEEARQGLRFGDEAKLARSAHAKLRSDKIPIRDAIKMKDTELSVFHKLTPKEVFAFRAKAPSVLKYDEFLDKAYPAILRQWGKSKIGGEREREFWTLTKQEKLPTPDVPPSTAPVAAEQAAKVVGEVVSPKIPPLPGSDDWVKGLSAAEKEVWDLYGRKQDRYLTHVIDRKDYLETLRSEQTRILGKLAASKNKASTEKWAAYAQELKDKIASVESGRPILYQDVPGKVFNRFFQPRTANLDVWQKDTALAFDSYIHSLAKKMFDEPVAQLFKESYSTMSPGIRKYATWYMRRYMGMEKSPLTPLMNKVKEVQWVRTLGISTRSAITNLSQRFNTLTAAPRDAIQGYAMGFTEAGKKLFDKSGLPKAVPGALMNVAGDVKKFRTASTVGGHISSAWDFVRDISGVAFKAAEHGNQKHAFLTGYRQAKRLGKADDVAMQAGIDLARRTQFRYGRTGTAKLLTSGGGVTGTALQFWSYPMKQIEFLADLAKRDPGKLLMWWGMAEGTNYAVGELLGLDMSGALGLGINYSQLLEGLQDLQDGDIQRMKFHLKQSKLPLVSLEKGGLLPQGMGPVADTITRVAKAFVGDTEPDEIIGGFEPMQIIRFRQLSRALLEGKDEAGQLTVRAPYGKEPLYREREGDILARTFIAKPLVETEQQRERKEVMAASKMETIIQRKIAKLIEDEQYDEAQRLMEKYEIPIDDISATLRAAKKRQAETPKERTTAGRTAQRQLRTWNK